MKRVSMFLMCLFALMATSLSVKAQEITINLRPGWNWIGYPNAISMELSDAFGDFMPMEGDVLKSEFAFAEYLNGNWVGNLTNFMPGRGYMYCSNRTEETSFVFRSPTPQSQVLVTTAEPLLITTVSAMSGGEVTTNDGTYILMKGLCWAAHENPMTNNDFYQEAGSGVGSFTISMTGLNIGTTYYVRAYAVTPYGTVYGNQKSFTTRDGIPVVSTDSVTNIWGNSATCFGTVTDNGGLDIIARGFCWSASHTPTLSDDHTIDGAGVGGFSNVLVGLLASTTYYVRAYASNGYVTVYGAEVSFTTLLPYVDLGLPSGLLWAICNVGADTPEGYGDYYAWGEIQSKDTYNWSTYKYCHDGQYNKLTKYCNNYSYGYNGYSDNLSTLLSGDDAATANWGVDWRMPTKAEWEELKDNTTVIWTTRNGVNGQLFVAANGNSLFLPAAGYCQTSLSNTDDRGSYWSSSLSRFGPTEAYGFGFTMNNYYIYNSDKRCYGLSVRAVRSESTTVSYIINAIANPIEGGTVSGEGTYQEGVECTLTATATEGYTFINWIEKGEVVSTDTTYSFTVTENRNMVANFIVSAPTGAINGKFSINADGDQVYFSKGNLQYQASTSTWRFAENQYDYIGVANSNISASYSGWIDLFGWCTSGYHYSGGQNNRNYQPWSTSTSVVNATYNYYGYGPSTNINVDGREYDWGVHNAISNGGNQKNQWVTPSMTGWNYLFNGRSTTSGIRFAKAQITTTNGTINGVILLPDDWSTSYYNLNNTNTIGASFNSNTITSSQWDILERYGAVFLPAAGYRLVASLYTVGSSGYYWSMTTAGDQNCDKAHGMNFGSSNSWDPQQMNNRCNGQSVRLVRSVQ